jgi:C4-dicarboxylate transporter DctM subunit
MNYLLVFLSVFLIVAMLRVPVYLSMASGAFIAILFADLKLNLIGPAMFNGINSFAFLAVPAFICAGDLMAHGGISESLLDLIGKVFQRIRGSLGAVVVVTSMLFGAITGSSLATISAIGGMIIPDMLKNGYSKEYTTALIAASGFLGILIPPSVPGVIFAVSANLPVLQVWLATLVPGIILGCLYMIANYLMFGLKQDKINAKFVFSEYIAQIGCATPKAAVSMLVPLVIFVGVYGGIFTPTEAGAVSVLVGLIIAWGIFPLFFKVRQDDKPLEIALRSTLASAGIMMIIAVAHVVSEMIAYAGIAAMMTGFIQSVTKSPAVFLFFVNVMLILVGMFLETNTSILLFTPILVPMARSYNINLIHFSAIVLLNLEIGMITPPFAVNLFTSCKLTGVPMNHVIKHLMPFLICCLITLILVTYFPAVSMFFLRFQ